MVEPTRFEELEYQIEAVLETETTDFFEVSEMLGLDPKQDFAGADLSGVDLSGKDLSYANFTGANLQGVNLSYTNLEGADFTDADLSSPLLIDMTNIFQIDNSSHNLSDLILLLARARARAFNLDCVDSLEFHLGRALTRARALGRARTRSRARSRARARARSRRTRSRARALDRTYARAHSLARALVLDLAHAHTHAYALAFDFDIVVDLHKQRNDLDKIIASLNQIKRQNLGATFRDTNLQNTCWHRTQLEGTLMINTQGLSPEEITGLKARGVIFDDAPGDRSSVTSPRSPVPV